MVNELPFEPVVRFPANLTVKFDAEALTTADPGAWCQRRAAELLGPQAGGRDVRRLADSLEEHLRFVIDDRPVMIAGVCFYPDFATVPPQAMVTVEAFGWDTPEKALTMDKMRDFYATPDEMSFGETELTETELPSGPAMRVHRYRKGEPGKQRSRIIEEITWLVWPPGYEITIALSTLWGQTVFAKAGAVIADEMAQNFRVEPKRQSRY
jgi:hypothetical protein